MNLLSILLGLACLVFAVHSVQVRGCLICCTCSLSLSGLAVLCQLLELNRLMGIRDWAAIEDTLKARCIAGIALLALAVALNLWALLRSRKKSCESC